MNRKRLEGHDRGHDTRSLSSPTTGVRKAGSGITGFRQTASTVATPAVVMAEAQERATNSIRMSSVVLLSSLAWWLPGEAQAGCDATVSATAVKLAQGSAAGSETVLHVALESFDIDPAFAATFQPALTEALSLDSPQATAAAMTTALRELCRAFAGTRGLAVAPPAAVLDPAAKALAPTGNSRTKAVPATAAAIASLKKLAHGLDTSAPEQEGAGQHSWLTRSPHDRTREQIELDVVEAQATLAAVKLNRASNDPNTNDDDVVKATALYTQAEQNALLLLPSYGLFVGPSYTQNSAGGFDVGIEAYTRWDSGRFYYDGCGAGCTSGIAIGRGWYRGYFDASFQDTDATPKTTGSAGDGGAGEGDGNGGDGQTEEFDIFGRDKGRLRVNAGVHWHPFAGLGEASDWMGVAAGLGFTAPQVTGDSNDGLNRGGIRWFAGLHSVTRYRYGLGELTLGYAKDKFWNIPCAEDPAQALVGCGDFSDRYFVEGMFNLVNAEATDWSLIGKISADLPTKSGGESDVVVSVMLRRDLNGDFTRLAGK